MSLTCSCSSILDSINLRSTLRSLIVTKYSKLIDYLLVAEKNNELLMKNHQVRLIGAAKFPEMNDINNYIGGRSGCGRNNKHNCERSQRKHFWA